MSAPDDEPLRDAWRLVAGLFMADRARRVSSLSELGLAPTQAFALHALDPRTPLTMSELAEGLRCDNSNVTGVVDRLESVGLVERRPAAHDRRIKTLVLTARGEEVRGEVERRMSEPPPALAGMDEADARLLRDILTRTLGH